MTLEQLKSELAKINQGCEKRFEISENRLAICGRYYYDEKEQTLCPSCQAEISALKKGISACEEILSQQNKMTSNQGMVSNPNLTEVNRTTGSADTEQEKAEGVVYPKGDSDTSPVQTLIKQALSQRNQEILEVINNWSRDSILKYDSDCPYCQRNVNDIIIKVKELKKQLTTEGEGKNEKI